MSGGGSSRPGPTQTTVQTNQLPSFLQGPMTTAANRAEELFRSGVGSAPFPGSTYVPPGADEMAGLNQIRTLAGQNPFMGPVQEQFTGLLNNQGITGDHRSSLAPAQRIAQGDIRIGTGPAFGSLQQRFLQPSASEGLRGIGGGSLSLGHRFDPSFSSLQGSMSGPTSAAQHLGGLAGGQQVAGAQGLQGLLGGLANPMTSERFLGDAASGQFLGADGNPHFNQALDDASQRTMQAVNAQMAGMGRLGSDAHTGVGSREIGELQTRARADQHNLERQLQMAAAGQMDQARLGRQGQQLQGTGMQADIDLNRRAQMMQAAGLQDQSRMAQGGLLSSILGQRAGLMGQDIDNRMRSAGQIDLARQAGLQGALGATQGQTGVQAANIANQGQTSLALGDQFGAGRDAMLRGMAMGPAFNQARFFNPQQQVNVGAGLRGESQEELQSNINRFQAEQMQPWGQLGLLTSALQGMPTPMSNTTTQTSQIPRGSPIAGALGGGLSGASAGAAFGPWGAGIGGLLGGLGGAFL